MKVSFRKALAEGFRQTNRSLSILWISFGVNFVLALIPSLIFRSDLMAGFGSSLAPEQLINRFDFSVYLDFMHKNPGRLNGAFALVTWFVILNNFLSIFLDGGIIGTLGKSGERFTSSAFFSLCGRFTGRFLRLFLVLILAIIGVGILAGMASGAIYSLVAGNGETDVQIFRAMASAVAVFLLPMSLLMLTADYARVITVADDRHSMFKAFGLGVSFTFRHLVKTYGLYLILIIPALALLMGWGLISFGLDTVTIWAILGVFLLQQVVVLIRLWLKIISVGSQVALYASSKPAVVTETQPGISLAEPVAMAVLPSVEPKPEQVLSSKTILSPSRATAAKTRRTSASRSTRKRVVPKTQKVAAQKRITKKKTK